MEVTHSIPAALTILACEGHLKPIGFDHQKTKTRKFDTILNTFSHQYVQVMLQSQFFCRVPSGGSRPCNGEQVADSHLLVALQSRCESSFYFIPEHIGKKIPTGKGEFYNMLSDKLKACYFFLLNVFLQCL